MEDSFIFPNVLIFWVILLNLFDLAEKAVMRFLGVAEFESVLKFCVVPFLGPLVPIFAQNFNVTHEKRVVRGQGPINRVSR